ncbi:MAG: arginine--tRNA ligase [Thermodesulfobacteriota bacterium]|nr:arginine--tRNA ligase [Thermodesulfobacteriota bacterium]
MKKKLTELLEDAIKTCSDKEIFEAGNLPFIEIEVPREDSHGDYSCAASMALASSQGKNPRRIAEQIVENIHDSDNMLDKIEIAGPGFINFFIGKDVWSTLLEEVDELGNRYGQSGLGKSRKVQVEFVSANPTGPLHIGHARGAVIGDVIANILESTGFSVFREYYINDAGTQMDILGKSVFFRYQELLGMKVDFPPECYQGEYIKELAGEMFKKYGDQYLAEDEEDAIPVFTDHAVSSILNGIKEDLNTFGVIFDSYFSEKELYKDNGVKKLIDNLRERGFIYEDGGAFWFKTEDSGDEKDRVVIRENGEPTYFAADIAYHQNKYSRGFDTVIDVWGADHHGYIPRMYAGVQALGKEKEALEIVLVQLVNLFRSGKPVAMSTRTGEFVTLKEVVDEVGRDAVRYHFLMRRSDSHLDFDLELAKKQSNENPVYYVQYAHARISSIMRLASSQSYEIPGFGDVDLSFLTLPEEITLIKEIVRFPEVVEGSAKELEPHRLTFYLNNLASVFHSYYNKNRVISDDLGLSTARLFLVKSVRIILRNALKLLGVSAPERM